jgi:DNA-binding FadR family transcriptional regulator
MRRGRHPRELTDEERAHALGEIGPKSGDFPWTRERSRAMLQRMRLGDRTTRVEAKRLVYGHAVLQLIAAERLEPAYRFPPRTRLARDWGVGTQTASEALNLAVDARFVGVVHGDRTEVLPRSEWNVMHPLVVNRAHRSSPTPEAFLTQYVDAETTLEVGTILAVRRPVAPALVAALDASLREMEVAARFRDGHLSSDYRYADSAFHGHLAAATGNLVTAGLSKLLREALAIEALVRTTSPADVAEELAEHRVVLAGLIDGDLVGAAQALRAHLAAMAQRMARSPRGHTLPAIDRPEFVLRGWRP